MYILSKVSVLFCLIAISSPAFAKPELEQYPLTPEGIGPIKIGMTLKEAESAAEHKIPLDPNVNEDCDTASLPPEGLTLLLEKGKISRITLEGQYDQKINTYKPANKISTLEGIKIGDSEIKAYTTIIQSFIDEGGYELTITQNTYGASKDHYLKIRGIISSPNGYNENRGYMFETVNNKVTTIHAGQYPAVGYIEGCI